MVDGKQMWGGGEGSLGFDMGRESRGKGRGSFPKTDREEHLSVVMSWGEGDGFLESKLRSAQLYIHNNPTWIDFKILIRLV